MAEGHLLRRQELQQTTRVASDIEHKAPQEVILYIYIYIYTVMPPPQKTSAATDDTSCIQLYTRREDLAVVEESKELYIYTYSCMFL